MKKIILIALIGSCVPDKPTVVFRPPDAPEQKDAGFVDAGTKESDAGITCSDASCPANAACSESAGACECLDGFIHTSAGCLKPNAEDEACCVCLALTIIPGNICNADGDCSANGQACWCTDAACTTGQCGADEEIGPDSIFDEAACICLTEGCVEWSCGMPVLIGADVGRCLASLTGGQELSLRADPVEACPNDCAHIGE